MTMHDELTQAIFDLGPFVRYVAYGEGQRIGTRERDGLAAASAAESDVGYGNFAQLVMPTRAGHVSVALEREADAPAVAGDVARLLERFDMAAG